MNYNAFVDLKTRQVNKAAIAAGTAGIVGGARWFWWIALLSLLHCALVSYNIRDGAPLALSITHHAQAVFSSAHAVAYVFLGGMILFFLLVGWAASRGSLWAFIAGAVVYGCDALLSLQAPSKSPFFFHLLALFFVLRGAIALHQAIATAEIAALEHEADRREL